MKGVLKLANGTMHFELKDICNYIKNDFVPEINEEWDEFSTYDFIIESLTDGHVWLDIMSKGNASHLLT
jgi:hypothetical protein